MENTNLFTKKDISDRALDLKGKIKNLQVSISIFRKEMADLEFKLAHTDMEEEPELVTKWESRVQVLKVNIAKKESELEPLKEERNKAKLEASIKPPVEEVKE